MWWFAQPPLSPVTQKRYRSRKWCHFNSSRDFLCMTSDFWFFLSVTSGSCPDPFKDKFWFSMKTGLCLALGFILKPTEDMGGCVWPLWVSESLQTRPNQTRAQLRSGSKLGGVKGGHCSTCFYLVTAHLLCLWWKEGYQQMGEVLSGNLETDGGLLSSSRRLAHGVHLRPSTLLHTSSSSLYPLHFSSQGVGKLENHQLRQAAFGISTSSTGKSRASPVWKAKSWYTWCAGNVHF